MHEDTFLEVESGATIITSGGRLARVLAHEFHRHQKEKGRSVWKTPDVLPLDAFLKRIWREWVMRGTQPDCPALLSPLQEQMVWEQAIRQTPEGGSLLQIPQTAKHAMGAWEFGAANRPLAFDGSPESEEHTSELQSLTNLACRLLLAKKNRRSP